MPKFTAERKKVRNTRLSLESELAATEVRLAEIHMDLNELREQCPHPARKEGSAMGRSHWHCPDCGASHP